MPKKNKSIVCEQGLQLEAASADRLALRSSCDAWTEHVLHPLDFSLVLSYLHWSGERIVLATDRESDLLKVERFRAIVSKNLKEAFFIYFSFIYLYFILFLFRRNCDSRVVPGRESHEPWRSIRRLVSCLEEYSLRSDRAGCVGKDRERSDADKGEQVHSSL